MATATPAPLALDTSATPAVRNVLSPEEAQAIYKYLASLNRPVSPSDPQVSQLFEEMAKLYVYADRRNSKTLPDEEFQKIFMTGLKKAMSHYREYKKLSRVPPSLPFTLEDLHAEFNTLRRDFPSFRWHRDHFTIDSEPVILRTTEGESNPQSINLGRFRLSCHPLQTASASGRYIKMMALEPNPCPTNRDVLHPHVTIDSMCMGEAEARINQAAKTGRFLDMVDLVFGVLYTWSEIRPFRNLRDWTISVKCDACGEELDYQESEEEGGEEEPYSCSRCGHSRCSQCIHTCKGCENYLCEVHKRVCVGCDETYCSSCRCHACYTSCAQCGNQLLKKDGWAIQGKPLGSLYCNDCTLCCNHCDKVQLTEDLTKKEGLCYECAKQEEEEKEAAPATGTVVF